MNWKIEFKLLEAHTGTFGNEIANGIAKDATQNSCVTYRRIPKSAVKEATRNESIRKWQREWEETTKGAITKEFFSKRRKKTGSDFKLKPKSNNSSDRPRKYSIILTPINDYRKSRVPM